MHCRITVCFSTFFSLLQEIWVEHKLYFPNKNKWVLLFQQASQAVEINSCLSMNQDVPILILEYWISLNFHDAFLQALSVLLVATHCRIHNADCMKAFHSVLRNLWFQVVHVYKKDVHEY